MRRTLAVLATALLLAGSSQVLAGAAKNSDGAVSVPMDEAKVIAFPQPVATIYIANPSIADITMIDKRHAFVQGKSFGATNIIALDAKGAEISNRHVVVYGSSGATVTLQRGNQRTTYACTGSHCEASPRPGDSKDAFDNGLAQIQKQQELAGQTSAGAPK